MKKQKYYLIAGALLCSTLFVFGLTQTTHAATQETLNVLEVIEQLKPIVQAEVNAFNATSSDLQIKMIEGEAPNGSGPVPAYQPESLKAAIFLNKSYFITAVDADNEEMGAGSLLSEGYNDEIIQKLKDLNFVEYKYVFAWPPHVQYINESTGVICAVSGDVGCGHKDWYSVSPEWEEYLNGIGEAYYAKEKIYPVIRGMNYSGEAPTIYNSDYKPYQYTYVGISNGVGMFYRSSPTASWVYFGGGQAAPDCSEFTGESQKGFAGTVCYDGQKESKVKVATATTESQKPKQEAKSSSVKTPDTGFATDGGEKNIAINSLLIILTVSIPVGIAAYIVRRFKNRVSF